MRSIGARPALRAEPRPGPVSHRVCPQERIPPGLVCLLILLAVVWPSTVLFAQEKQVLPPARSVPLHSLVEISSLQSPAPRTPQAETAIEIKPFLTPDPKGLRQWKELLNQGLGVVPPAPEFIPDTAPHVAPPLPRAPTVSRAFEGLTNADNAALTGFLILPPDNNLGVGPSHVFQIVNIIGRITDKLGGIFSSFTLRSFFGVDPGFSETDPRVIYDAVSGRWFAVYLQFSSGLASSSLIVAVSTTSDPTGTFCRYRIGNPTSETFLQDFPMLGVSDDKVVVSYNGFSFPLTFPIFLGAGYYVLNKADLTACSASLNMTRVPPNPSRATPFPAQSLGSTSDLFVAMNSIGSLTLLTIGGVPGVSVVTETSTTLGIRFWTAPPSAPQAGSSVLLDTNDERVVSVAWQNHSLWVAGNEGCTPTADFATRSCLRVIEVRTDNLSVRQDMTFGAPGEYFYYPAVRPDVAGNAYVVFTRSSTSSFASVRITGRLVTDPLNTLQASSEIRTGGGAQTHPSGRMGDYSGAALDPSDPLTVWVMGEYIQSTGIANWGTYVAQLRFFSPSVPVTLSLNKKTFRAGETLRVDITVANPGPERLVDVYFGALLPPQTGGCPGRDPIAFLADGFATTVVTCLTAPATTFGAHSRNVSIPAALPVTAFPNFFSFLWTSDLPAGFYTVVLFFTPVGALGDGRVDAADVIALAADVLSFIP